MSMPNICVFFYHGESGLYGGEETSGVWCVQQDELLSDLLYFVPKQ